MSQNLLQLTSLVLRIQECHTAAKQISGARFGENLRPWMQAMRTYMGAHKVDALEAALELAQRAAQRPERLDPAVATMWLMAAALELINEAKTTTTTTTPNEANPVS